MKEIRTNRLMNILIHFMSREDGQSSAAGGQGEEMTSVCVQCGGLNVVSTCLHCRISLCKNCKDRHCRLPGFQTHRVVSMEEVPEGWDNLNEVIMYCSSHPAELIRANCVTCNVAICSVCKLEEHDTHKSESVHSALTR